MRLMRHGESGAEKPGLVLAGGKLVDVSQTGILNDYGGDYGESFWAVGNPALDRLREWIDRSGASAAALPSDTPLGAPTTRPPNFFAVGINDPDHAKETNSHVVPGTPVMFSKSARSHGGFNRQHILPQDHGEFRFAADWEIECGFVVLGYPRNLASIDDAANYFGGLFNVFDGSDRVGQLVDSGVLPIERIFDPQASPSGAAPNGGQWIMGKGFPTSGSCGPYLLTPDEVGGDLANLNIEYLLSLNGERKQSGNMSGLTNNLLRILYYLSHRVDIGPGDIVTTGTPKGVGMAEGRYLTITDTVSCGMINHHPGGADFGTANITFVAEKVA